MKIRILTLALATLLVPQLFAEKTNVAARSENKASETEQSQASREEEKGKRRAFRTRQIRLMEKALDEIGVTEEQRQQIRVLQAAHMKKMKANWIRLNEARRELSRLQDIGAPMEELNAAILAISDAQMEQLQTLVHNRKEMEEVLGKEKSDLFMQKAHEYYRKHGSRPGAGMPPHPTVPPIPGQNRGKTPPPPPVNGPANPSAIPQP